MQWLEGFYDIGSTSHTMIDGILAYRSEQVTEPLLVVNVYFHVHQTDGSSSLSLSLDLMRWFLLIEVYNM